MPKLFLALCCIFHLYSFSQVIGGRNNSEMTPTVSKPSELNSGGYTGDVNLFSGGYGSVIPLGKVATPGGIAFGLELNYSSSFSIGSTAPITKGIPYGEGWNLNIPTISIESQIFNAFTFSDYCNENSGSGTTSLNYSSVEKAINEGDLYWYSPYINIPGVASGRAIFKYVDVDDNKTAVFELNTFENHVEIRYDANKWTIITSDGTIYEFKTVIQSFNAPANKRVLYYPINGASTVDNVANNVVGNNDYSSSNVQGIVENSITPKQRYNLWYCDAIRHKNKPFQSIVFFYKGFGKFNYFKEFQQEAFRNAAPSLLLNSTLLKEYDFSCYTDLLLVKMESYSNDGLVNRLAMNYQTNQQIIHSNDELLKFNDPKNGRLDSLYTYRSVFKDDFSSGTTAGWKRYEHTKANEATNPYPAQPNPYISPSGYVRSEIPDTDYGPIPFNHCFLESPRLFEESVQSEKLIPGDIYEVKTNIIRSNQSSLTNGNATIDIAVVTGTLGNNVVGVNNAYNFYNGPAPDPNGQGFTFYNPVDFEKSRGLNLFSTFNMALKWTMSYSEGLKQTSNFFSMPNFPSTFHGLNIQVGPGNSDISYNTQPALTYQVGNVGPFANQAYHFCNASGVRSAADIGSNFGIGLPWAQMIPIYKRMVTYLNAFSNTSDATNSIMKLWWNDLVPLQGYTHDNVPTKMDESVKLSELELLRYTKNPYMLTSVEFYQVNGEIGGPVESGLHLISGKKLEYKSSRAVIPENYHYENNDSIRYKPFMQVIVLLDKVRDIPINGITDTTLLPTTFLSYEKFKSPFVKYNQASPLNGYTGMVLSKIVDQLGGITKIEYYPVNAGDNRTRYNSNVTFKDNCGGLSVDPPYGNQSAVTVSPIVQTILKNDEDDLVRDSISTSNNGHKKWTYDFDPGSKVSRRTQYFVSIPRFFETQLSFSDVGFGKVTVYGPALVEGSTNFVNKTVYEHYGNTTQIYTATPTTQEYQNYLFHGKLKSVKEYDVTNKIHTEKLIAYDYTLAYKNGYTRPDPYKRHILWEQEHDNPGGHYEYRDYYLNIPVSADVPGGVTLYGTAAYPWLDIPAFNGPVETFELPKFMEFEFYPELHGNYINNPEFLFHSYFIKKTEEINRKYDDYLYKLPAISSGTLPHPSVYTGANPFGTGHTNPRIYSAPLAGSQIVLINTASANNIVDTLMARSPIMDSVLYHVINTTRLSDQQKMKVLMAQGNLSNLTLNRFIAKFGSNLVSASVSPVSVLNQQNYITDEVLIAAAQYTNLRWSTEFVEALFLKNEYLSEQVVGALADGSSRYFSSNSFLKIMSIQPQFSETSINKIINSRYLTPATLPTILKEQVITDNNFQQMIGKASILNTTIVEIIETGNKYPSEAVFNALMARTPAFSENEMERIIAVANRDIESSVLTALRSIYGNRPFLVDFSFKGNPLDAYCNNAQQSSWNYIETKTTYEYYEADYTGTSNGRAYKVLMGLEDIPGRTVSSSDIFEAGGTRTINTLRLKHEPSWQVFSITNSSPHLPTAKDEKQYFYLYDLKNRYDRYWYNYDIKTVDGVGTQYDPLLLNQNLDTVMSSHRWDPAYIETYTIANAPELPKYDGMTRSRQYAMRSTPFQQTHITKNQRDAKELRKSEYYLYDARWPIDAFSTQQTVEYNGPSCPAIGTPPVNPGGCASCVRLKNGTEEEFLAQLPFNYCLWKDPVIGYYACPSNVNYALCNNGVELIGCDPDIPMEEEEGGPAQLPILNDILKKSLQLRSTIIQLDTILDAGSPDFSTKRFDRSNTQVADFYVDYAGVDDNGFAHPFKMLFPYDTLTTSKVLKRNQHLLPTLISNQVGLQTKFYYNTTKLNWNVDTNCNNPHYSFLYNYSSVITKNIGLPVRVTVGYGRADSLATTFEYTNDGQVRKMTSPSGHYIEYSFDGFNRLKSVTENGNRLLSRNEYQLWKHNSARTFKQRTDENYVYSVLYQNNTDTANTREFQKAFIDPLGRKAGIVKAYRDEGTIQVSTGSVDYDNWGRPRIERKPSQFVDSIPVTPLNPILYKYNLGASLYNETRYENNPGSLDIRHSDPGVNIADSTTVKKQTWFTNDIYLSCELGLSRTELNLIMNSGSTSSFRFLKTSVKDQDNKESITYTNALGQTVATMAWTTTNEKVVTLFVYDSYGNLMRTINALRQNTDYQYNLLGQLIRETNVDGGQKRYIYNKHGKISAVQDQLDRNHRDALGDSEPRYRKFEYDPYGNLTAQSLVINPYMINPFCFETQNIGTPGDPDYFRYTFSNRMTQDWRIQYKTVDPFSGGSLTINGLPGIASVTIIQKEKEMVYGTSQLSPGTLGKLTESYSYNSDGSAVIQKVVCTYNSEDLLASQVITQHPTNIATNDAYRVKATISYSLYNFRGSLVEQKLDMGSDGSIEMKYFYDYDQLNRLQKVVAAQGDVSTPTDGTLICSYVYDNARGTVVFKNFHGQTDTPAQTIPLYYDDRDRLTGIGNTNTLFREQLYYDATVIPSYSGSAVTQANVFNGNVKGIKINYTFSTASNSTSIPLFSKETTYGYKYDRINRLVSADALLGDAIDAQFANTSNVNPSASLGIGDELWKYDKIGNILIQERTKIDSLINLGSDKEAFTYTYFNGNNRLKKVEDLVSTDVRSYGYDDNGNMLTDSYRHIDATAYIRGTYPYRVTQGSTESYYLYDGGDQRIYKKVAATSGTTQELYIKDALGRDLSIVKFTTAGGTTPAVEYFIYGTDRAARITKEDSDAKINVAEATYFIYDHLGNTRVAFSVNASNIPTIVNAVDYYSYGKILREYDNGAGDRYLTTQHERDRATGLDYRGARYYDSDIARFLSTDPWAAKYPSWSTYNYVMGNPVMLIDPTGKGAEWIPRIKDNGIELVKEKGDNAQTLAQFLDVKQEVADRLYNNACENGNVELNNTTDYIPGLKNIVGAIVDYKLNPDNYGGYFDRNYDCHASSLAMVNKSWIAKSHNIVEGYELSNELKSGNYTDVTSDPDQYKFGQTLIRFGNDAGNTKHSATYLGTSKDGTIYTWSKNGNGDKPGVFTVKQLEKIYNAIPQGVSSAKGGGFYNSSYYE